MRNLFLIFSLLFAETSYSQPKSEIWLIGTAHEENSYINPDSLTNIFNKTKPDLILLELEEQHFTKEFSLDTLRYRLSDYLTTNENISSYKYQQQNKIQLRPFDLNGRHDFYKKENYHEQENKMFGQMLDLYKKKKLSESCKVDFEILLATLSSYSELQFSSLREANSDVTTKFLATKNKINFELIISIIKQTDGLKKWLKFAELRKDFWDRRNKAMAENIIKYTTEFAGKRIVILVGNDHKYALLELLKQGNITVKNYWEN